MLFGQSSWPILVAREEEGGSRPLSSSSVTSLALAILLSPAPSLARFSHLSDFSILFRKTEIILEYPINIYFDLAF